MEDVPMETLMNYARSLGVSDVRLLSVDRIPIEDALRLHCESPRCPNYGTSANCPPHGMTPTAFREFLADYSRVLVFKFDFPLTALQDSERWKTVFRLHDGTASIEHEARNLGYARAQGFSSGGCKHTFCREFDGCIVLEKNEPCRFPDKARPSLSGMGVNWHEISRLLGWRMLKDEEGRSDWAADTVMLAGLVFVE